MNDLRLNLKPRKSAALPIAPKKTLNEHGEGQQELLNDELEPALTQGCQGRSKVYFVDAAYFVFATYLG
jgi:hypothetical protein